MLATPSKFIHIMLLILLMSSLLHIGCRTNKVLIDTPSPDRSKSEILHAISETKLNFDWYASKAQMKFISPQESGKGSLYVRIKNDSLIWITAKKFGVTGARVLVRPDSFSIVYQLQRQYEHGALEDLENIFSTGASFSDMQQLLVGNIILPSVINEVYDFTKVENAYTFKATIDNMLVEYEVDAYSLLLNRVEIHEESGRSAIFTYDDYRLQDQASIPYRRTARFNTSPTDEYFLDFDFKEILINVPKSTKFKISPRFTEIKRNN